MSAALAGVAPNSFAMQPTTWLSAAAPFRANSSLSVAVAGTG
jgi:hypothetical protein